MTLARRCYQQLRSAYHTKNLAEGRAIAVKIIDGFHTCPIPEIARLGRTLRAWKDQFLAYFTTARANNGGTEAINGIIELHRRISVNRPSLRGIAEAREVPRTGAGRVDDGDSGVFGEERRWTFEWWLRPAGTG